MSYYQKYRPRKWAAVIGQDELVHVLMSQARRHRWSHAYLLHGPSGTGKTTIARLIAMSMNCSSPRRGEPCGRCQSCDGIQRGAAWDVIELDGARFRGIDDAKSLAYRATMSALGGGYKVYIIDECHALTGEAFQVMLKLLEEPPPNVALVLCTTEPDKVPATVRSRCQVFGLQPVGKAAISDKLAQICRRERLTMASEALSFIAGMSQGNLRTAEGALEQATGLNHGTPSAGQVRRFFQKSMI